MFYFYKVSILVCTMYICQIYRTKIIKGNQVLSITLRVDRIIVTELIHYVSSTLCEVIKFIYTWLSSLVILFSGRMVERRRTFFLPEGFVFEVCESKHGSVFTDS